jgi:hypothetical protein
MNVGGIRRLTTETQRDTEDAQRMFNIQACGAPSVRLCVSAVNCLVPYTQLKSALVVKPATAQVP